MDKQEKSRLQNESNQQRRKEWFLLNGPCAECGSWQNLELDHIDKTAKTTHKIWSYRKEKRDAELAKCRALCDSCHNKRHSEEKIVHGTVTRYKKKCRCEPCREAWLGYLDRIRGKKPKPAAVIPRKKDESSWPAGWTLEMKQAAMRERNGVSQ